MSKLQLLEKKGLFQVSDKPYELGTIGPSEILGLETMMSSTRTSLFTYEIISERFSYISVPHVATQLLFNKDAVDTSLQFFLSILEHRMSSLIKKFQNISTKLEDDSKFEYLNGQISKVEKNVKQLQAREANPVEIDLLIEAVTKCPMNPLNLSHRNRVLTLQKNESKLTQGQIEPFNRRNHLFDTGSLLDPLGDFDLSSFDNDRLKRELKKEGLVSRIKDVMKKKSKGEEAGITLVSTQKSKGDQNTQSLVSLKDISATTFNKEKYKSKLKRMESKTESELFEGIKVQGMKSARLLGRQPSQSVEDNSKTLLKTAIDVSDFNILTTSQRTLRKTNHESSLGKFVNESLGKIPLVSSSNKINILETGGKKLENNLQKNKVNQFKVWVPSSNCGKPQARDKKLKHRHTITHLSQGGSNKEAEFDQISNTCKVVKKESEVTVSRDLFGHPSRKITMIPKALKLNKADLKASSATNLKANNTSTASARQGNSGSGQTDVNQIIKESVSLLFKNVVIFRKRHHTARSFNPN